MHHVSYFSLFAYDLLGAVCSLAPSPKVSPSPVLTGSLPPFPCSTALQGQQVLYGYVLLSPL